VVAEADRRIIGAGILSIRPSVRPGPFVGVLDALGLAGDEVVDAPSRLAIGHSIIEHLVASARNKGCARVEVADPLASAEPELLDGAGFERRGVLLSRAIG
jgi:hypothetical protein